MHNPFFFPKKQGSMLAFEEARVKVKSLNIASKDAWEEMVANGAHELDGKDKKAGGKRKHKHEKKT
jgi:hypothetical protein